MMYLQILGIWAIIALPLGILIGWLFRDNDDPLLHCQCAECRQHKGEN